MSAAANRNPAPAADSGRIAACFKKLKSEKRGGLVTFVTAGDPDAETARALLKGLPGAGADMVELGMPFSDPMADGPAIQASSLRALRAGTTLRKVLGQVREFRQADAETPLILMGYFNPIYVYGAQSFLDDAKAAGVDGLIVVDLPPEEDAELCFPAIERGLNFIRLATPTTDDDRLPAVLAHTSGFIYYVSITGITGTKSASAEVIGEAVTRLRRHSELPIAVGFGIKTPQQAAEAARLADAAVVGSALVETIAENLDDEGRPDSGLITDTLSFVRGLAEAIRGEAA